MRKKNEPNASLDELFKGSGIRTQEFKSKRIGFGGALGSFVKLTGITLAAALMLSIFPLMGVATAVMGVEPAVEVWKNTNAVLPKIIIAEHNYMYDKNGAVFAEFWTEDRIEVNSLDEISMYAQDALVSTEDKRFYDHIGFDIQGTVRSALTGSGGGSGITQQLIKNLQFYNLIGKEGSKKDAVEQSYTRKLRELKMALQYEEDHSKEEILLEYFNTVAFGGPTVYGIETASRYFFDKKASELTLAESAALVGSAQNPAKYNLAKDDAFNDWKKRQVIVLERMVAEGKITKDEADAAREEKLEIVLKETRGGNCYSSKYPIYCQYVNDFILDSERFGETLDDRKALLAKGGLHIQTSLDPKAMNTAEKILKEGYGVNNRVVAPTAIVEPGTGNVLAIAQNRDWGEGKGKTSIVVPTVPAGEGSVYKIFTLAAALNNGYTEDRLAFSSDCPLYPGPNYDSPPNGFKNSSSCALQGGYLNYKQAVAYSSNTWFVTLQMKIGVEAVKEFSKSVGLAAPDNIGPRSLSYTLGTVGNSPIDIAAAIATFSNHGVYCPATPLTSVKYGDGTEPGFPDTYNPENDACRAVMSPHNAGIVLKGMRANLSGEVPGAFGLSANIPGYDTVGKSGTNQNYNTTWAQLSAQYSIFTNAYDMDRPKNGIDGVYFRGYSRRWSDNTAKHSANDILRALLKDQKNIPLDYDNPDKNFVETVVNESDFFTVPSVVGMSPETALNYMRSIGITANVSKTVKGLPEGFTAGVIVEQSIPAGEKLSRGTSKEIILYIGQ